MKPALRSILSLTAALGALLLPGSSCKKAETAEIAVEDIVLSDSSLELTVGQSATLSATVRPADATDPSVEWSSTKPGVASVDSEGKVSALSQGHAYIVALNAASGAKASCLVSVNPIPAYEVSVSTMDGTPVGDTLYAYPGMQVRLSVSSGDSKEHQYSWECPEGISFSDGALSVGAEALSPSEGYLHCSSRSVRAVSEDGFYAEFAVVSNISSTFLFGSTEYEKGASLSLSDGKSYSLSLLWDNGSDTLQILPAESYSISSSDSALVAAEPEDGKWQLNAAAGRDGEATLFLAFGDFTPATFATASVAINPDYDSSVSPYPYREDNDY